MNNFRSRIASASFAQGVTALAAKAVNLLLAIVLARLLYPDDYGLFTITLIVTGLANMVGTFGFQTYIIQAESLSAEEVSVCYTLNFALSAALALMVAIVASVWPDPPQLLREMLLIYAVLLFISGLTYINIALLKRDLRFKESSRVELAFTAVSMSGRVAFAAAGFGALCFPIGDLLGGLVRLALVRRYQKTSPKFIVPRLDITRRPIWFGMHATSVGLASFVANQTDKLMITASQSVPSVGLYGFASNTSGMFYNAFIVPQTSVFLAMFARMRNDLDSARDVLSKSTRLIFSWALPLNVLWILESERLLEAVFGAQWVPAAPLVKIFAVDYLVRSMVSTITGIQMSFGLASKAAKTKWINASVFVVVLSAAAAGSVSLTGYAVAYVVANLISTAHIVHVNGSLLQVDWRSYWLNLVPPALIALASTLVWLVFRPALSEGTLWFALGGLAGVWLATYTLLTCLFNRQVIAALWIAVKNGIGRGRR